MNQTPDSPAPFSSWPARHRRIVITAAIGAVLIVAVLIGALLFIRSGRLNRYIISQVEGALAEYGLRAQIGGLDIAWGVRTARAHDIKVYNQKTGKLIATVDRAEIVVDIPSPYALRLRREVVFKRIDLVNLHAYAEIDETDSAKASDSDGLHRSRRSSQGVKESGSSLRSLIVLCVSAVSCSNCFRAFFSRRSLSFSPGSIVFLVAPSTGVRHAILPFFSRPVSRREWVSARRTS